MCRDRAASEGTTDAAAPCRAPPHHRRARGARQGGAGATAPRRARRLGARRRPARPRGAARGAGATRVPELVPIRYGRMLVSPFTFYRGGAYLMAADLAATPAHGPAGAALRRRAPVELRRLRRPRPAPGLQRQRLRRDAAGPVRVGRQAPRGQLRGRRPRPRLRRRQRRGDRSRVVTAPTARPCAEFAAMTNLELWYAASTSSTLMEPFAADATPKELKRLERNVAKARAQGQRQGVRRSSPASSTASRGSWATRR